MNNTLEKQLTTLIKDTENNNYPLRCEVTKNYTSDPNRVDITTNEGDMTYVEKIGGNTIGARGIVFFLNGDRNTPFCIIE